MTKKEHSIRYHDPKKYDKLRRVKNDFAEGVSPIYGITKAGTIQVQSVHFDASMYSMDDVEGFVRRGMKSLGKPILVEPAMRSNPASTVPSDLPIGSVRIYDQIVEIRAVKGEDSLWPGEPFKHEFSPKSKAAIYGLPNGDILIRSQTGKRLHKKFNY